MRGVICGPSVFWSWARLFKGTPDVGREDVGVDFLGSGVGSVGVQRVWEFRVCFGGLGCLGFRVEVKGGEARKPRVLSLLESNLQNGNICSIIQHTLIW